MHNRTFRAVLWGGLAVVMAGVVFSFLWTRVGGWSKGGWEERPLEGLERFGTVPDFLLTERSGAPVHLSDLKGKILVVNFIYTSCQDTCPLQSAAMARLQDDLKNLTNLRLVSISVDPERDTPKELSRYAERFHADPERWLFLTGEREEIYRLAQKGFRLSAVPAADVGQKSDDILHSSRFVLVDGRAEIRGYYDSSDSEALQRARRDIIKLSRRQA